MTAKIKIGILGYGNSGKFLSNKILNDAKYADQYELVFVWNRTTANFDETLPTRLQQSGDLAAVLESHKVDLVVEVCHPAVIKNYGSQILQQANLYIASVTALANAEIEDNLRKAATQHCVYIPSGAAWGVHDVQKMAAANSIEALHITMQFNADALKLNEPLKQQLLNFIEDVDNNTALTLYHGPVRALAQLAPNNVNTMTCLALAANTIGLDKATGTLIAQKEHDAHLIDIEVTGQNGFKVTTQRYNPAKKGAVSGAETYHSFLSSLVNAKGGGSGFSFC